MTSMTGNPMTTTKLTADALQSHLALGIGGHLHHEFELEAPDDRVSEVNADYGMDSCHSLGSTDSKFEDIHRFGRPGDTSDFICSGTLDRCIDPLDDDEGDDEDEENGAGTGLHTQHDPMTGNRVAAARLALMTFEQTSLDFPFESTVQHRNTARLPEVLAALTLTEQQDEQVDVEKAEGGLVQKSNIIARNKGLAGIVAAIVILTAAAAFLLMDIDHSAIVSCGVALFLAILAVVLTTTR